MKERLQWIEHGSEIATWTCFLVVVVGGILVVLSAAWPPYMPINLPPELELAVALISAVSLALLWPLLKVWERAEEWLQGHPILGSDYEMRWRLFCRDLRDDALEGGRKLVIYGVRGLVIVLLAISFAAAFAAAFLGVVIFIAFFAGLFTFLSSFGRR